MKDNENFRKPYGAKRYLGDGVYADFDGYHIVLTAENGLRATNTIYLDSTVMAALTKYNKDLWHAIDEANQSCNVLPDENHPEK